MRRQRERARFQTDLDGDGEDQGIGLLSGARRNGGILQQVLGAASGRGNGYGFEPVGGEEDLPMRSMGRGPLDPHHKSGLSKTKPTTKDLYDAFGNASGSEEGSDDNNQEKQQHEKGEGKVDKKSRLAPYNDIDADDEYMDSFLEDPDANTPLTSRTSAADDPDQATHRLIDDEDEDHGDGRPDEEG